MKMKVCYVTHLPNLTGASRSLLDMLAKLDRDRIEPIVLLGKHGPIEEELKKLNIRYKVITYSTSIQENNKPLVNLIKEIKIRIAIPKIKKFIKDEKIDLVHNNSILMRVGAEAAYKTNTPFVCHMRDFIWEDHGKKLISEKKHYEILKKANMHIAISKAVYKKFSLLVGDAPITTINDGLDIEKYLLKDKTIFDKEEVNLLLPGRIQPGKGQLEAIKAIEELTKRGMNNIKLVIVGNVGDAEYDKTIKDYVSEHNISQVQFISFTKELKELQLRTDIGLVCSKAEALGRVTVESMLSGCLTIGAKAGATEELIEDGETGLLYELGDYKDLADKIVYATENVEKMRAIAKKGQKYAVESFDNKDYSERILKIYENILK